VDEQGERYHALHPEPYFWAHATFLAMQYVAAEYFAEPLTDAEKEQLYRESIRWYVQYGMSLRVVPPDYAAFQRYWEHTVTSLLVDSAAIRRSALHGAGPVPPPAPWIPRPLWALFGGPLVGLEMWLARGLLPAAARQRLGWTWSAREERRLRRFVGAVRTAFRLVSPAYRLAPTARRAFRTARVRPWLRLAADIRSRRRGGSATIGPWICCPCCPGLFWPCCSSRRRPARRWR
jgi:uncharacterized protein (DUF2236 family)